MDFALTDAQRTRRASGRAMGRALATAAPAGIDVRAVVLQADLAREDVDGVGDMVLLEALAVEAPGPAVAVALQVAARRGVPSLRHADRVVALALTSAPAPVVEAGRLRGTGAWLAPLTVGGLAVVGAHTGDRTVACLLALDAQGVSCRSVEPAGLSGLACAHVELDTTAFDEVGPPQPVMAWARLGLAAVGLGMGRRALEEAMRSASTYERTGPGGEQTLQGLLADVATELDAATLLVWDAAQQPAPDLAAASMAKLLATEAAQRAVSNATQVVGLESFHRGHVLAQLAHDVRALELFAGRTEALREAIAARVLPPG